MIVINTKNAVRTYMYNNFNLDSEYPRLSFVGDTMILNKYLEFKFIDEDYYNKIPLFCNRLLRNEAEWLKSTLYENVKILKKCYKNKIIVFEYETILGTQYDYNEVLSEYRKIKIDKIIE